MRMRQMKGRLGGRDKVVDKKEQAETKAEEYERIFSSEMSSVLRHWSRRGMLGRPREEEETIALREEERAGSLVRELEEVLSLYREEQRHRKQEVLADVYVYEDFTSSSSPSPPPLSTCSPPPPLPPRHHTLPPPPVTRRKVPYSLQEEKRVLFGCL